ncbi:hypothetical protein Lal_00021475, partial [Lupinus albus]
MKIFLTVKKVAHVLNNNVPVLPEQVEKEEMDKINENDYLCKNLILNGLSDDIYDYYSSYKFAKLV